MSDKTPWLSKMPEAIKLLRELVEQGLSDPKIRTRLEQEFGHKWNLETIRRNRKKLGVKRDKGIKNQSPVKMQPTLTVPPPGLDEIEKAEWFRDQFKKTHLFTELKEQLHAKEIKKYLEEYGVVCCQFEDIVSTEFFQIDDFLKHRILIGREMKLMKDLQDEVDEVAKWISMHPIDDDSTPEERREHSEQYVKWGNLINALKDAKKRYDNLAQERQKISQNLAATRKDRLEELRGGKESFLSLVVSLQQSEKERKKQGKYAELTRLAAKDSLKKLREPAEFPDGTIDPVIIDGGTDFGEQT